MKIRQNFFYTFLALLSVILAMGMVIYPQATFNGASNGFKTWVFVLIPALLPFFIIADIIIELGVLRFIGVLLEPLMRPVFKQPGAAGLVLAMGFTSGFPMGAILTNRLYEDHLCTKDEAARLIAFTNNSSPLFLLVAVPIGMFQSPALGVLLAFCHYSANLLLGILLGYKKSKDHNPPLKNKNLLQKSYQAYLESQSNSKSLGTLMGNAIRKSLDTIFLIGGFIIFFAVLIEILHAANIFPVINIFFTKLLVLFGFLPELGSGLTTGFFEMTLGTKATTDIAAPMIQQAMLVSFILGWSGLSIQAQVSSILGKNMIPIGYYLFGRLFQGIVASLLMGLLYNPFLTLNLFTAPVFNIGFFQEPTIGFWYCFTFNLVAGCLLLTGLLFMSFIFYLIKIFKNPLITVIKK